MFYQSMTCAWVEALSLFRGFAIMNNDNENKTIIYLILCFLCGRVSLKVCGGVVFERGHVEKPSPSFEDLEDMGGLFACVTPHQRCLVCRLHMFAPHTFRLRREHELQHSYRIPLQAPFHWIFFSRWWWDRCTLVAMPSLSVKSLAPRVAMMWWTIHVKLVAADGWRRDVTW